MTLPFGKLTQLWKITMFNGQNHYKWPCSIALSIYQRVIGYPTYYITLHYLRWWTTPGSSGMFTKSFRFVGWNTKYKWYISNIPRIWLSIKYMLVVSRLINISVNYDMVIIWLILSLILIIIYQYDIILHHMTQHSGSASSLRTRFIWCHVPPGMTWHYIYRRDG